MIIAEEIRGIMDEWGLSPDNMSAATTDTKAGANGLAGQVLA